MKVCSGVSNLILSGKSCFYRGRQCSDNENSPKFAHELLLERKFSEFTF